MVKTSGLVGFEHVKFEPVSLTDCTGEVYEFHSRTNLFGLDISGIKQLGPLVGLLIVQGKGHEEVDEYFQSDRLSEFLLEQLAKATTP
jgi:hypothetical protein